jgi:hypothetical protein
MNHAVTEHRQRPGHNQSVDVSYFAQTPDGQRGNQITIDTRSQRVRSLFQLAEPEPVRVSWPRSEKCRAKGNTMQLPSILQGESLKRLLQGAAAGAVAPIFVGFYWGGWSLGSTTYKMAKERSELAVVTGLGPVCADKFRALPDAEAKQVALSKLDSWKRRDEFPKEFVTLPANRTRIPPLWTRVTHCCLHRSQPRSNRITATSGGSPDVVLCPDVVPSIDSRFDCSDLLQRSVIHYGTAKASAIT